MRPRQGVHRALAHAVPSFALLLLTCLPPLLVAGQLLKQEDTMEGYTPLWASFSRESGETTCTCERPCDLNTASFEDLQRLLAPLALVKTSGVDGAVSAYNKIVKARPLCNVMELASMKKVYVQPGFLAPPPRPNPGYLLIALWGCGGNQGMYGTLGGRGGCCPVTASSIFCGIKKLFGTEALNRNMYTKEKPDPSCDYTRTLGYSKANPPPWCYTNDKYVTFDELRAVAAGLNETSPTPEESQWTEFHMRNAFTKLDADGDKHISQKEYLDGMGLNHLGGLPRAAIVREPWERSVASSQLQEKLQKCTNHYGATPCLGNNPTGALTVDIDHHAEEQKKYPNCVMLYEKGSYERVNSGQVCCEQTTWEWLDGENNWRPLLRGECLNNPLYNPTLNRGLESRCLEDVGDKRNGAPEDPDGVKRQTEGDFGGSRRRSWKRIKPVSEILQERFVEAKARMADIRNSGTTVVPTATFQTCYSKKDAEACGVDPNCRWHEARMPHDAECRSVWDIGVQLDRDQLSSYTPETKEDVLFDVRDRASVEMDPPVAIQTELRATFWNAGQDSTYPLWWREMLLWLKEETVPSEPSGRRAVPKECRGKVGLMIFLAPVDGSSVMAVAPRPRDLSSGEAVWGGVHKLRQKMHYPRWIKRGNAVRCGCYPPPLSTMPEVDLYPGCAATENVCLTPPDWSKHS